MRLNLHSVTKEELINTGATIRYYFKESSYILMQTNHPVTIYYQRTKLRLEPGSVVWGRNFSLENSSNSVTSVTSLKFKLESTYEFQLSPFFIVAPIPIVITNLFDLVKHCEHSSHLMTQLSQITKELETQINVLSVKERNDTTILSDQRTQFLEGEIDRRLIKVNRFIRNNFHKPLTLQELADLISCHPVYLSNMYTKVFDKSPIKHIQTLRMNQAKKMLKDTNLTIHEITLKLGYVSTSQFSSLFKQYFNVSPTNYRNLFF